MDAAQDEPGKESQPLRNIVLVGFMGSGKSSIGRELHQSLGYQLIDTDHIIEEQTGKNIPEIFARDGEQAFRDMETRLLENLLLQNIGHHIISTGGGMVCRPGNRELLRKLGFVVWLKCTAGDILKRTSKNANRPLLQCNDPMETINHLLEERSPFYADVAHLEINTTGLNLDEISCGILESARYYFGSA
jgi:shikimate kinase